MMARNVAHFTLDGKPACECMFLPAYYERFDKAGSPRCSGLASVQARHFARMAAQFPGRVALVSGECPNANKTEGSDE